MKDKDSPATFGCSPMLQGYSLWQEALMGAPKIAKTSATDEVPVWFIPLEAVNQVIQNGVLTTGELEGIDVLLVGYVDQINETIQLHPLPSELGGGGHPNPRVIEEAKGELASIFQFPCISGKYGMM